jgi:hypothetical protein
MSLVKSSPHEQHCTRAHTHAHTLTHTPLSFSLSLSVYCILNNARESCLYGPLM